MTTAITLNPSPLTSLPDTNLVDEKCDRNERNLQNLAFTILMLRQEISILGEKQEEIEDKISRIFKGISIILNRIEQLDGKKETDYLDPTSPPAKEEDKTFKCSGHSEFFHRYQILRKAKKKAEVKRKEKEHNIKQAKYELIEKDSPEGRASVYFKCLNNIYSYAINIIYYHEDNNRYCPYHPDHIEPVEMVFC